MKRGMRSPQSMKEKELIFEKRGEKNLSYLRRERTLITYTDKLASTHDVARVASSRTKSPCQNAVKVLRLRPYTSILFLTCDQRLSKLQWLPCKSVLNKSTSAVFASAKARWKISPPSLCNKISLGCYWIGNHRITPVRSLLGYVRKIIYFNKVE